MTEIEIRPAVPEDSPAIVRIHHDAALAAYSGRVPGVTDEQLKRNFGDPDVLRQREESYRERVGRPDESTFVVCVNGLVVGFSGAAIMKLADGELQNRFRTEYIGPEWQRRGIGMALFWPVEECLPSGDIYLDVVAGTPAVEFHKKLGFVSTGRTWKSPLKGSQARLPQTVMYMPAERRGDSIARITEHCRQLGVILPKVAKLA